MNPAAGSPFISGALPAPLVLASRSPRRSDILTRLGFTYEVSPAPEGVESGVEHEDVMMLPELLARRKADAAVAVRAGCVVLAADTLVILDGEALSKPANDAEAVRFIERLSGQTHCVITGVAVAFDGHTRAASARTQVTFRTLRKRQIERYVATGEGRDKAGGYAAQGIGSGLIHHIEGCFYNVVGLPVAVTLEMLQGVTVE